jgi:hypothetical protein
MALLPKSIIGKAYLKTLKNSVSTKITISPELNTELK